MPDAPGLASTDPRALLRAVVDILPAGVATVAFGAVWIEGHRALFVTGSNLVIGPVMRGREVVERAVNVERGTLAEDIAADLVTRFAGRSAA